MNALKIAEQIYQDVQTLCFNSKDSEYHTFVFNGIMLDYCLTKKRIPENNQKEVTNPLSKDAYNRLLTIFTQCKSNLVGSAQTGEFVSFNRRVFLKNNMATTDEQFAFLIFSMALKNRTDFFKFGFEKLKYIFSDESFFLFNQKDSNENPIQRMGIETNFNKETFGYLLDCYDQWPETWKEHCNYLFEYIFNQLSIPKDMIPATLEHAILSDQSIFIDVILITHYSQKQVTEFLNNKHANLPVKLYPPWDFREDASLAGTICNTNTKINNFLLKKVSGLTLNTDVKSFAL